MAQSQWTEVAQYKTEKAMSTLGLKRRHRQHIPSTLPVAVLHQKIRVLSRGCLEKLLFASCTSMNLARKFDHVKIHKFSPDVHFESCKSSAKDASSKQSSNLQWSIGHRPEKTAYLGSHALFHCVTALASEFDCPHSVPSSHSPKYKHVSTIWPHTVPNSPKA